MKKMMLVLVLGFGLISSCWAADAVEYNTCVEYLYTNYNARTPMDYAFSAGQDGLELVVWRLPVPKPTFAELDAVKDKALAWKSNQMAEAAANMQNVERQTKAAIRAVIKLVNERLPADKKITEDELKAAIKAEALK